MTALQATAGVAHGDRQVSVKNLSGPLSIAAVRRRLGRRAASRPFLGFLVLISLCSVS